MRHSSRIAPRGWLIAVTLGLALATQGCGYLKNVRDDLMDCFMIGGGVVTPVMPGDDGPIATGSIPPSFGVYLEATEFLHLGALFKASADIEMDRRATGLVADQRLKLGIGPFHYIDVKQTPIHANDYKWRGNDLDGWRENMRRLKDPIFGRPGKQLIFDKRNDDGKWVLHRGWQDWETFSVEIAIPEPFILHSGINFRVGIDPSQIFDLALGLFGIDLYNDNAYRANGDIRFQKKEPTDETEKIRY
jgi:hypothetical protein